MRDVKVFIKVVLHWHVLSLEVSTSQFSQLQANDNYFAACYDNGVLHVRKDLSTVVTFVHVCVGSCAQLSRGNYSIGLSVTVLTKALLGRVHTMAVRPGRHHYQDYMHYCSLLHA